MSIGTASGSPVVGIKYTMTTDSSSDWPGVTNSTYFYDLTDKLVYFKDSIGDIWDPHTGNTTSPKSVNIQSIVSSGTITPDAANDIVDVTALAVNTTIANGTGTPTDKQVLEIHILDAGVSKTLNVGTNYVWYVTAITDTTAGKRLIIFCEYSLVDGKWLILKTITQP